MGTIGDTIHPISSFRKGRTPSPPSARRLESTKSGLRVVLDVVYNHTYAAEDSALHMIVPGYYHRTDEAGGFANGSGCGNELATERPMVRKLIIDSLKYWALEYHVDGFRFDLMALIDYDTMKGIASELKAVEPSLLLYGEPWAAGPSGLCQARMFTKGRQRSTGIGVFNDSFRNAIKGDNDGSRPGYATGGAGCEREIAKGVVASIHWRASRPSPKSASTTCRVTITSLCGIRSRGPARSTRKKIGSAWISWLRQ